MRIWGCGDVFIAKRLPRKRYDGFEQLRLIMQNHDVCFGNLETTVHNNEGYPSRFPGGGYAMANPLCLEDLKEFGFNALNIGNNHSCDYSHKGLEATIKYLNASQIPYCGAGFNLVDASRPKYVECADGRVALIGVTSSFHDSDAAGPSGGIIPGRPGVNPLRRIEYYELKSELYKTLETIASETGMNDGHKWSIANGYREESNSLFLREMQFVIGNKNQRITHPLKQDMNRIIMSIKEASLQSDCIVISVHSHQMDGSADTPARFIREFCHTCIDEGAHIIFGHGAHELQGLEIYKGFPIFYGMGDFLFHNEMQEVMPSEFYEKVGVEESLYDFVGLAMDVRSKHETRGLQSNPKAWQSIGASVVFEAKSVRRVTVYPITLDYDLGHTRRGWPRIDDNESIENSFCKISNDKYDTRFKCAADGIGYDVIFK